MRIAILEFDYHAEVLARFCALVQGDGIELTVYTKPSVYQLIPANIRQAATWVVAPTLMPTGLFLLRHLRRINGHDLIMFNTAASHFAVYCLLPWKPVTLVRNHNTHTNFAALSHLYLPFTPYFLYKAASYLFRRHLLQADWLFRPWFYGKVTYVSFLTEPIEQYALANSWISPGRVGPRLPIVAYEPQFAKTHPTPALHLTIPGTLDNRKKDYALVLNALKSLAPDLSRPLVINLLGRPKDQFGQAVCRDFRALASAQITVNTWETTVPQADFDRVMAETDLILAPILLETSYAIYREQYGTTKISGAIFDMIRYGKPIVLPASYPLDEALMPMAFVYNRPEALAPLLAGAIARFDGAAWQQKAAATFAPYTENRLRAQTVAQLQALLPGR